jgi:hypothetical protein
MQRFDASTPRAGYLGTPSNRLLHDLICVMTTIVKCTYSISIDRRSDRGHRAVQIALRSTVMISLHGIMRCITPFRVQYMVTLRQLVDFFKRHSAELIIKTRGG